MKRTAWMVAWILGVAVPAHAQDAALEEILRAQDDVGRGASSAATMVMTVKTARYERALTMRVLSQGRDRTLVRIEAPAREKGTATLKVDGNIWNYLPKVDRTIKVPGSMMSSSWMGSHFSNDDLVRESRFRDHFACKWAQKADATHALHVVDCTPRADAPVVWGRVRLHVRPRDKLADRIEYHDEQGALVRTMVFSEFGVIAGRTMARRMQMLPADKPGESTEVYYQDMAYDVAHPAPTFTLQALKN